MALPAQRTRSPRAAADGEASSAEDAVPLDPGAIEQRYRLERARRRARERHKQETALARVRFYAVVGALVAAAIVLLVLTWDQVQRLFGL